MYSNPNFISLYSFFPIRMVKTQGGASSKKRFGVEVKATASVSKQQKKETTPPPSLIEIPVASPVATEATKPICPAVPKGMQQKARVVKPTTDMS